MANPTHSKIVIARDIWIRRTDVSGGAQNEGESPMRIARRGESLNVVFGVARDLVIAESAIEDKAINAERIAELRETSKLKKAA